MLAFAWYLLPNILYNFSKKIVPCKAHKGLTWLNNILLKHISQKKLITGNPILSHKDISGSSADHCEQLSLDVIIFNISFAYNNSQVIMATLKEIRLRANLTQQSVSDWIKMPASQFSLYENNVTNPILEDMLLLEKKFGQRIEWQEKLSPLRKHEVVQSIIELCERYPLPAVTEFCSRMFRKEPYADKLIVFYSEASAEGRETPLPPTGIEFKTK